MNELDLFAAAIAIADPSERALLLERECAGRPELRLRLDQLLDVHFRSSSLLDQPDVDQTQGRDQTQDSFGPDNTNPGNPRQDEQAGVVIAGKYTLVEGIGKGGMGTVWRARQTAPVKRFVAVKLIKAGMDSKQVLARFDAERQAATGSFDGSPEHRQGARRRIARASTVLRHGTGQGGADHRVLR